MTIDERALPERVTMPTLAIGEGEICQLDDPEQVAAWAYKVGTVVSDLRHTKTILDERLRDLLAEQAATTIHVGDIEVSETTGTASYDVTWLMQALKGAGMREDVVQSLFEVEWKVRDAKELQKLENRHDAYGKVIAQARSRKRGRIVVKRKRQAAPAPRISDAEYRALIDKARSQREGEAEASDLGI